MFFDDEDNQDMFTDIYDYTTRLRVIGNLREGIQSAAEELIMIEKDIGSTINE